MTASSQSKIASLILILLSVSLPSQAGDWGPVTDKKDRAAKIAAFQLELRLEKHSKGKLSGCTHFLQEAEGRVGQTWGAICVLSDRGVRNTILVCEDDGVGSFEIEYTTQSSDEAVADFMERNCSA